MTSMSSTYTSCYYLRGGGDIAAATAIQARLREHGVCSYFTWDPRPPRWRFFFESDLSQILIVHTLGTLGERFGVEVSD